MYVKDKDSVDVIYWRCVERGLCTALIATQTGQKYLNRINYTCKNVEFIYEIFNRELDGG